MNFKVNLDTMDHDELGDYIVEGIDYVNQNGGECKNPDLIKMLDYAQARQHTIEERQKGCITQAFKYEDYCEELYNQFSPDWKW
jgi:hypothetical protein